MGLKPRVIIKPRGRGRPRSSPAPKNRFAVWLEYCGLSVAQVAKELGVAKSTVYGLRNATFEPGPDLQDRIRALKRREFDRLAAPLVAEHGLDTGLRKAVAEHGPLIDRDEAPPREPPTDEEFAAYLARRRS